MEKNPTNTIDTIQHEGKRSAAGKPVAKTVIHIRPPGKDELLNETPSEKGFYKPENIVATEIKHTEDCLGLTGSNSCGTETYQEISDDAYSRRTPGQFGAKTNAVEEKNYWSPADIQNSPIETKLNSSICRVVQVPLGDYPIGYNQRTNGHLHILFGEFSSNHDTMATDCMATSYKAKKRVDVRLDGFHNDGYPNDYNKRTREHLNLLFGAKVIN